MLVIIIIVAVYALSLGFVWTWYLSAKPITALKNLLTKDRRKEPTRRNMRSNIRKSQKTQRQFWRNQLQVQYSNPTSFGLCVGVLFIVHCLCIHATPSSWLFSWPMLHFFVWSTIIIVTVAARARQSMIISVMHCCRGHPKIYDVLFDGGFLNTRAQLLHAAQCFPWILAYRDYLRHSERFSPWWPPWFGVWEGFFTQNTHFGLISQNSRGIVSPPPSTTL